MTFNKYFPNRPAVADRTLGPTARALLLRSLWWVSTLMLVAGYVLMFAFWNP